MLRICNLNKNYKNFKLSIEDLYFESGKMYGLVGENGSGKTTKQINGKHESTKHHLKDLKTK